jgi:hypothetical protein
VRAFRRCRRLHHLRYEKLRRPLVAAKPLGVGSLGHAALEEWWRWWLPSEAGGKRFEVPLDAALAAIRARVAERRESDGEVSPFDVGAIRALIVGYDARWFDACADELDVIAVEAPFACPLVNPDTGRASQTYRKAGKIDVVLRRRSDGALGFGEHKTTSSSIAPDSSYWPRLRMESQVSTYYDGLRSIGYDARFCLYDVLAKPKLEPLKATPDDARKYTQGVGCKACGGKKAVRGSGDVVVDAEAEAGIVPALHETRAVCGDCGGSGWKAGEEPRLYANQRDRDEDVAEYEQRVAASIAEDPNAYYQRMEVVRLDGEIREHLWDMWQTTKSLHETRLSGRHARNPDACFNYGRACEYFEVCSGGASIDDDEKFRTVRDPHEELADGDDGAAILAAAAIDKDRSE